MNMLPCDVLGYGGRAARCGVGPPAESPGGRLTLTKPETLPGTLSVGEGGRSWPVASDGQE